MPTPREVTCECGTTFTATHPRARFCSSRCRTRASRGGRVGARATVVPMAGRPVAVAAGGVRDATRRVLDDANRTDTPMGQAALALAVRIDSGNDTGSALATAVRGLDEALRSALEGVAAGGKLLSLKDRRARRNA